MMSNVDIQRPPAGKMLDHALALYEMGLRVIPLGDPWSHPPPSVKGATEAERMAQWCKRPRVLWEQYQKQPTTEANVRDWWTRWPRANIGVLTGIDQGGYRLVVVDADSAAADRWLDESGEVATTPVLTQTARGRHRWYRMPANLHITNASSAKAKIDLRGVGGYVVAPGSTYADGTHNEWIVAPGWDLRDFDMLPELSNADLGAIQRFGGHWGATDEHGDPRGPRTSSAPHEEILADLGAVKLPHDGSPVEPGGRNQALASLAGTWITQGFSLDRLLREARAWNANNPQPLGDHEVLHTLLSILSTHAKKAGTIPHAHIPDAKVEIFSWAEMDDAPPAVPETYWREGVLFDGARVLLAGPPKIGKSNLVLQLALAAASGGEFLGHRFEKPLRVLWLQAEIHRGFLHQRVSRLMGALTDEERALVRDNFSLSGRLGLDLLDGQDYGVVKRILADCKPDLLILDPVINFSTAEENDNTEMHRVLKLVDALSKDHRCATVLVHHTRKDASAGDFNAIRGASALRGWFDSGFLLTGQAGDAQAILSYELRNAPECTPSVLEKTETGRFSFSQLLGDELAEPMNPGEMPGSHSTRTTRSAQAKASARTVPSKPSVLTENESRKLTATELLRKAGLIRYSDWAESIAKSAKVSLQTARRMIADLADAGVAVRAIDPEDKRGTLYRFAMDGGESPS